ncbi:MAG: Gfo/Idh/MocA family oxidoreductase, partial [Gemmatimonadetes bacterium]|nr:Gfo/Idh/MocA family oxidoreductase [Gemmatimonadota bacterium]
GLAPVAEPQDPVTIGTVVGTHGVRGTVRVRPTGTGEHLREGVVPSVAGAQRPIKGVRVTPKGFLLDLKGVDDRRAANSRKAFPKAKYYKDYREMLDKEAKNIDAVSVSTPDHMHAVQALAAMQLGKHVYVQKPLTHDIYEARVLTDAAKRYKVVTQMGNQGASGDGTRVMKEWYDAGLIGDVHTIYAWTDRPVWPQGIPWPTSKSEVPKELDWNLWLGTAPYKEYADKIVPFNWRGWWTGGRAPWATWART